MKATILRGASTNDGTPGRLTIENGWTCDTIELPWRNNKTGVSCINADTYRARLWESSKLGCAQDIALTCVDGRQINLRHFVYRLEDKHGRRDCLIHNGAFAGDTALGEETHVHGCTIVGRTYGVATRDDGGGQQMAILYSRPVLAELIKQTRGEDLEITYEWAGGCEPEDLTDAQGAA